MKEQLLVMLQNVNDVNKERTSIAAASSICVTQPNNGLITVIAPLPRVLKGLDLLAPALKTPFGKNQHVG